jgi:predicted nucleic acid-binding Zn ribbon protein
MPIVQGSTRKFVSPIRRCEQCGKLMVKMKRYVYGRGTRVVYKFPTGRYCSNACSSLASYYRRRHKSL